MCLNMAWLLLLLCASFLFDADDTRLALHFAGMMGL